LDLAINQLALGHLVDSRRANSNVINRYDTVSKGGNPVNSLPGADLAMKVTSPGIALLLTSFCGNDVVMGMMLLRK